MTKIIRSFRQSFEALLSLRMFLLVVLPPLVAFVALLIVFLTYWELWVGGLGGFFANMSVFSWVQNMTGLQDLAAWTAMVFLVLAFLPLAYVTAVLLTSVFILPVVLKWVVISDFPHLEKRRGGSTVGSLFNAFFATIVFLIAFVVTLPFWFLPGFQVLVPLALTAWLNRKIFVYDVLQDYASADERMRISKAEAGPLLGMGFLLGLLSYIPLAFFLVPVLSALSYCYYCLNSLKDLREPGRM